MSLRALYASMDTGCRLHGRDCRVVWGYDRAHTDSTRPYTTEELAERESAPHRYAYPTVGEYRDGFTLWRALQRDARPTYLENLTATAVRLAPVAGRLQYLPAGHRDGCHIAAALEGLQGVPDGFTLALARLCACTPLDQTVRQGWAPKADHPVTAQSDNHHADPPPLCGPVLGPGRNASHRADPNRIDPDPTTPAPGRPRRG